MMLIIWLALPVLAVLICAGIAGYVGWNLTHPERRPLNDSPANYQLKYEDVRFLSKLKDVQLKGWFLPASTSVPKMTIVFAHGYSMNRLQDDVPALPLVRSLVEAGFQVLLFDFRNSGESEGNLTSVGQLEKEDLLGAVEWVKEHHPGPIGLIGFSMGASTALMAAAEDDSIAGVVADSPFNHLTRYLKKNLPTWSDLPDFPFTRLILALLPRLTGLNPDSVDVLAATERIYPRPILFIHCEDDDKIPYTESEAMLEKYPDRFAMWKPARGKHVGGYRESPEEYTARVIRFFSGLC
nr:alpha/beta fold hydrolase [Aneurinibacillus sp. XH2]